jgi:hypothetical protein
MAFALTSPDFRHGATIPVRHVRGGGNCLRHSPVAAVKSDVASNLGAAGGVPDIDGVAEAEMLDNRGGISLFVAVADLAGTTVTAPAMGGDPISPSRGSKASDCTDLSAERPPVVEHDRLHEAARVFLTATMFCRKDLFVSPPTS